MKFYKILLKLIQIAVVLVVLPRVAEFVGQLGPPTPMHDLIRVAFALTLGLGTISTSYFANDQPPPEYDDEPPTPRERKRREREAVFFATMLNAAPAARKAMILFAFLDGTFNLADAVRGAYQNGMFDVSQQGPALTYLYVFATVLFGLAPTILAMMLSYVISLVDRIPMDYERPTTNKREIDWVRTVMGNLGFREFRAGEALAVPERRPILPPRIEPPDHPFARPAERGTAGPHLRLPGRARHGRPDAVRPLDPGRARGSQACDQHHLGRPARLVEPLRPMAADAGEAGARECAWQF